MMCFVVELRHVVPRFGGHGGPAGIFACDGFHGGVPPDPRRRLLHPGFGTLRSIEVSLGASRNPLRPALWIALQFAEAGSDKTFSKTTIRANVFSVGTATSRRQGAPAFWQIDSVRHQPLCGGTCIASDWRRPAGTRGRAGELFESSSRGAQQRGDAGVARRPAFPGLLRFARNDDAGSTQMQYALEAQRMRSWKDDKAL